jgi:hypothetical protein
MEQQAENLEEQMRERLGQLDEELEKGQEMLRAVESQQRQLTDTLLRISGARQVLLELLGEEEAAASAENGPTPARVAVAASPGAAGDGIPDDATAEGSWQPVEVAVADRG